MAPKTGDKIPVPVPHPVYALRSANQEFVPSLRYPASNFRIWQVMSDTKMVWRCKHD